MNFNNKQRGKQEEKHHAFKEYFDFDGFGVTLIKNSDFRIIRFKYLEWNVKKEKSIGFFYRIV